MFGGELAGLIQRDEGSAFVDELPEILNTRITDAARKLRRNGAGAVALDDLCLGQFAGNNDDVILRTQAACANVFIENIRERKLVVLKNQSRPAFVDRCDVAFIHSDARQN